MAQEQKKIQECGNRMKIKVFMGGSGGGPGVFMRRLLAYMKEHHGIKVVESGHDLYFSSVWRGPGGKANPANPSDRRSRSIHRADGVYFDTLKSGGTGMNKRIGLSINRSTGVVYQSRFSKDMCKSIAKARNGNCKIIYNGMDSSVYNRVSVDKLGYDKLLVACATWRPLKRPLAIAKGFLKANVSNAGLVMIGPIESRDKVRDPRIHYVGKCKTEDTLSFYKSADAVIHISRMDACPNVVVEALCAGVPVIGNNVGGTAELIKDDGVIVDIDPVMPKPYKRFEMRKPESVNKRLIAQGIHDCLGKKWDIHRPELEMSFCADQYYDFFKQVAR